MNADRVRLSVAILISVTVHGAIASFGDFPAGRAGAASRNLPVAVTIASMTRTAIQQPTEAAASPEPQQQPRPQEKNSDQAEVAKSEVSVPAKSVPEQPAPVQSSNTNAEYSRQLDSIEATDRSPAPQSEPAQAPSNEAVASTAAKRSANTSVATELNDAGQAAGSQLLPVPENPDVTAVPLYRLIPKPVYPSRSRDRGEEGVVIIAVLVGNDGNVLDAYVSESSGFPLLDGSALSTVTERWRFKPGMRRGKAVPSWVRVPIKFSIRGS